jgi:hypothetical protein
MKRDRESAKKDYLENIFHEIIEYQRRRRYDLMYTKTKN